MASNGNEGDEKLSVDEDRKDGLARLFGRKKAAAGKLAAGGGGSALSMNIDEDDQRQSGQSGNSSISSGAAQEISQGPTLAALEELRRELEASLPPPSTDRPLRTRTAAQDREPVKAPPVEKDETESSSPAVASDAAKPAPNRVVARPVAPKQAPGKAPPPQQAEPSDEKEKDAIAVDGQALPEQQPIGPNEEQIAERRRVLAEAAKAAAAKIQRESRREADIPDEQPDDDVESAVAPSSSAATGERVSEPPLPSTSDGLLGRVSQSLDTGAGTRERDLLDPEIVKLLNAEGVAEGDRRSSEQENERRTEPREEGEERRGSGPRWLVRPNRRTTDDPLLGCLTILCTLLERPISADALTAGLPLEEGHMTPDLFVRAAERAGISGRLIQRNLDDIAKFTLPCILLLKDKRACVLTEVGKGSNVRIVLPEMGTGQREVPYKELKDEYFGYAIFARPEFQFDQRAEETRVKDPKGWFWGTIVASWKLYVEVLIAAMLINLFAIASPLFTMNVYDRVVPNFAEETLWVLFAGVFTVFVFDFVLKLLRAYLVDIAGKRADTKIAARLFQQMLGMKMAHRPPSAGALANQMREFESLREFFTSSTLIALIDFPFIFMFVGIIFVIGGPIAIVPAAVVFIVIPIGLLVQMPMKRAVQETFREAQQKHAILIEAINGIETIKATASEGRMQRHWETFVNRTAKSAMNSHRWSQIAMNFSGFSMQMVTVLTVVFGVYLIQEGELTVGALVACTLLAGRALAPLGQIAGVATRFHQAQQSLNALDGMMHTPTERPEGRTFVHRPNFSGHIEFKNVGFTYPDAKTTALTDVSFNIETGEKVGIIGRIGSGKSTIERLVMALYDPTEGSVLIDNTDTRQLDPAVLRRSIGVVPQETYLFYGTVKDNIALGAPYADDEMILRAARIAGVDEFTSKHPQGLDMPVGERGASLSGGQRQSIGIARALLLDPPILIFDEPTSSMDNTTEGRFKTRMQTLLPNKTMILVTHRASLLSLVDRLLVMDGGRIVADGPKDEVMEALSSGRIQTAKV
ncbi:MAG: type I secretion system permease/ATPase [Alphaproteobacteria bacterium]